MQDRKLYFFSQSGHRHIRWPALLPQSACPNSDSYLHVNFISLYHTFAKHHIPVNSSFAHCEQRASVPCCFNPDSFSGKGNAVFDDTPDTAVFHLLYIVLIIDLFESCIRQLRQVGFIRTGSGFEFHDDPRKGFFLSKRPSPDSRLDRI